MKEKQVQGKSPFNLIFLFLAELGLHSCVNFSLVVASGGYFRCNAQAFHRGGFSCWGAQALGMWASVAVAPGL